MNKKNKIILIGLFFLVFALVIFFFYANDEKGNLLKRYFPETKLTGKYEYIINNGDTILDGKFTIYDEKGGIASKGNFANNKLFGKCIYYFDNGNIKQIIYRKNKRFDKEGIYNFSTGKIEKYLLFDDFGKCNFVMFFDEQGNVKSYEGYAVIEIYQYKIAHKEQLKIKTNQVLKVGDVLKYKYLLANIPNAKRSFKIELVGSDNTKIKRIITKKPPTDIDVEEVLTKKGKNSIKAVVEYKFNDINKTVLKDSVYFEVIVN